MAKWAVSTAAPMRFDELQQVWAQPPVAADA